MDSLRRSSPRPPSPSPAEDPVITAPTTPVESEEEDFEDIPLVRSTPEQIKECWQKALGDGSLARICEDSLIETANTCFAHTAEYGASEADEDYLREWLDHTVWQKDKDKKAAGFGETFTKTFDRYARSYRGQLEKHLNKRFPELPYFVRETVMACLCTQYTQYIGRFFGNNCGKRVHDTLSTFETFAVHFTGNSFLPILKPVEGHNDQIELCFSFVYRPYVAYYMNQEEEKSAIKHEIFPKKYLLIDCALNIGPTNEPLQCASYQPRVTIQIKKIPAKKEAAKPETTETTETTEKPETTEVSGATALPENINTETTENPWSDTMTFHHPISDADQGIELGMPTQKMITEREVSPSSEDETFVSTTIRTGNTASTNL